MGESLRPIIELDLFPGCLALIDTGAVIPVWTGEESKLKALEGVRSLDKQGTFSGFGGYSKGNLYEMTLNFGGLYYINLPIIASRMKDVSWHMVLPATIFDGMRYTIDNIQGMAIFEASDNQPVRHLKYQNRNGGMHILSQETSQQRLA